MSKAKQVIEGLLAEAKDRHPLDKLADESPAVLADEIDDFAQKYGSAVDIWGNEELWRKIQKLQLDGAKFKSLMFDGDDDKVEDKIKNRLDRWKEKGYAQLAREDNMSSIEVLIYKP